MPGMAFCNNDSGGTGAPIQNPYLWANSITSYLGDVMVLSTNTSLTSGAVPVLRSLLAADITAGYQASTIAAPSAPTLSGSTTGGFIAASSNFYGVITYVNANGETVASSVSTQLMGGSGSTNSVTITAPGAAAGASGWKAYLGLAGGTSAGPFYLVGSSQGFGEDIVVQHAPANTAPTPPTANTTGAICGILGIGSESVVTSASGTDQSTPTFGLSGFPTISYGLVAPGARYMTDPSSGRNYSMVITAQGSNVIQGAVIAGYGAITQSFLGTQVGINLTNGLYTWDPSAAVKIGTVVYIDTENQNFVASLASPNVGVRILSAYDQSTNLKYYTAQ